MRSLRFAPSRRPIPKHRRTSYANNLIGRSLLAKGDARGAAQVLLANYRGNPRGERAPDSLFYLGQALMQLGQPGQACKAYAELESVYKTASGPTSRSSFPRPKPRRTAPDVLGVRDGSRARFDRTIPQAISTR